MDGTHVHHASDEAVLGQSRAVREMAEAWLWPALQEVLRGSKKPTDLRSAGED